MEWKMDWKDPKPAPEPLALVQDFVNTKDYFHGVDRFGTVEEVNRHADRAWPARRWSIPWGA